MARLNSSVGRRFHEYFGARNPQLVHRREAHVGLPRIGCVPAHVEVNGQVAAWQMRQDIASREIDFGFEHASS